MYPTHRDWSGLNDDLRHQVMLISEHMERFAVLVSENASSNGGRVPSRMVREYVSDALIAAIEDMTSAIEINRQEAMEAA
jgi:hypothetical protein